MEQINLNQKAMELVMERMIDLKKKISEIESMASKKGIDKSSSVKLFRLKDVLATNEQFYAWLKDVQDNRLH